MKNAICLPPVFPVTSHTDQVGPSTTFVAIKGMREDGVSYISSALKRGARTIVVERGVVLSAELLRELDEYGARLERVENARLALAQLSAASWGYPAEGLKIIAVTGTKGKTTTAHILEHILRSAGFSTALLSTVGNRIRATNLPTKLTTQQPDYLHAFFHLCQQSGVEWVVMEVAAQAVSLHRVEGILFDAVIITNFSQEHAEFYASQGDYFAAKAALVQQLKPAGPLILNADDVAVSSLGTDQALYFGSSQAPGRSKVEYRLYEGVLKSLRFDVELSSGIVQVQMEALLGAYNAANATAAIVCAEAFGVDGSLIEQALCSFTGIPGRLRKYVLPNGAVAFIDHAHNPSSFKAVLTALRHLTTDLTVIFGAGGERDVFKRPMMGQIAAGLADRVILTTDNPRSEDPHDIIRQIQSGIPKDLASKVVVETDRLQAIQYAYAQSQPGSIIALLGKGCEEYQIIGNTPVYFSEARILESLI